MISKLPGWVWIGAWVLAFVAGMVNVVGLLGFEHMTVSHLSGNTTQVGIRMVSGDHGRLITFVSVIAAFLLGAMLSGALIPTTALQLGRRYGAVLMLETFCLVASVSFLERQSRLGFPLLGVACGLQNAMASMFSGTIVRTTHVTGVFTDIGVLLGHVLRGLPADWRRLCLLGSIIAGFFCGSAVAAMIFPHLRYTTLFVPAAITGVSSLTYMVYRIVKAAKA